MVWRLLLKPPCLPAPAPQVAVVSLACAYAGSLLGFASGIAGSVQATLQLGGLLLRHGESRSGCCIGLPAC